MAARVVDIGEAMIEMAPGRDSSYRRGYAGDTFNTIWNMAQLLGDRAKVGFVTRIGTDTISEAFASEMASDGLSISGIQWDSERHMGLYLIELHGAERSFHYWREDSVARHLADDAKALRSALQGAGLIHPSGITLAILSPESRDILLTELVEAQRLGVVISFDPNIRPKLRSSLDEARAAVADMLDAADSLSLASTTRPPSGEMHLPRRP
jgi:2-dehydro-3-deoxygluconokinase